MYIGSLGDFFSKGKCWLINQPKITKENKYHFIIMGGKIFKLDIYTGVLYEMNKNNNKNLYERALNSKGSNKTQNNINNKYFKNANINSYNKKQNGKKIISPKMKNILDQSLEKFENNKLFKKRNKSSNIKNYFSLTTRNYYKKRQDKSVNIYLNNKYIFNKIKKRNLNNKNTLEKNNCLTFDLNNQKRIRSKSHIYPALTFRKSLENENGNDSDNFIQEDICEIKKEDNGIITKVKNQIFKDKIFKILQKKYNFFKEDKNSIISIPKLKLDTARNLYVDKKNSVIEKILNRTAKTKHTIFLENKKSY